MEELYKDDDSEDGLSRVEQLEGLFDLLFNGIQNILIVFIVPHSDRDTGQEFSSHMDPFHEDLADELLDQFIIDGGEGVLVLKESEADIQHDLLIHVYVVHNGELEISFEYTGVVDAVLQFLTAGLNHIRKNVECLLLHQFICQILILQEFRSLEHGK